MSSETPKTHGEAFATNHDGYADRLAEMARLCAEQRQTAEYSAYLAAASRPWSRRAAGSDKP